MSSAALEKIAKDHGISIYQLGLAWLLHRSPVMLSLMTMSILQFQKNCRFSDIYIQEAKANVKASFCFEII